MDTSNRAEQQQHHHHHCDTANDDQISNRIRVELQVLIRHIDWLTKGAQVSILLTD